jgi:hypothetical protein
MWHNLLINQRILYQQLLCRPCGRWRIKIHAKNILEDDDRVISTPQDAAAEEGGEKTQAVDELDSPAGEVEFIAEPVDVEEGGGELEEDEDWSVEVDEWALYQSQS